MGRARYGWEAPVFAGHHIYVKDDGDWHIRIRGSHVSVWSQVLETAAKGKLGSADQGPLGSRAEGFKGHARSFDGFNPTVVRQRLVDFVARGLS